MQAAAPGLRERKKAETRAALHAAAVRLFLERGPAAVTVSDICEAAGVSARTFFNYFDAKEEALLPWDKHLIEEVITALAARPAAEPPLTAVRQAIEQALPSLTASAGWQAGDRVLTAYPELRATTVHGMIRNQGRLADALAKRAGQAGGSLYPQLLAGAAASAFRAAFSVWAPETGTAGLQALVGEAFDRLAAGLPPSRPDQAGAAGRPLAGEAGDGQITPAGQRLATPSSPRLTCKERQWARG
jgi:AcrR family transcriptional regulator